MPHDEYTRPDDPIWSTMISFVEAMMYTGGESISVVDFQHRRVDLVAVVSTRLK